MDYGLRFRDIVKLLEGDSRFGYATDAKAGEMKYGWARPMSSWSET